MRRAVLVIIAALLLVSPPAHAATRAVFVGGLYVDALVSGSGAPIERVVLYPSSRLETQAGRIDFPADESYGPMFLALSEQGDRFVGLAHDTPGRLLLYHAPHGWEPIDGPTSGRVVFDASGGLLDYQPAGYQFFDESTGQPVTRLDTYGPFHGLSEWVKVGDLYIGQGHEQGGIRVWDGGNRLRVLDEGIAFFLRRHVRGDRVALSYVKSGEGAIVWQTTLSELHALPFEATAPAPAPVPVPPVVTPPTPVPQAFPDPVKARAIVVEEREKLPPGSLTGAQVAELLKNIVRRLNREGFEGGPFGVLVKSSGTSCAGYSCDIVCVGNGSAQKQWDVLGDADPSDGPETPGKQIPGWSGPLGTIAVRPCEVPSGDTPPPLPVPPPPTCGWPDQRRDVSELRDALDAKARYVKQVEAERDSCASHLDQVEREFLAMKQELDALKAKPAPTCTAKVETPWARSLGARASCTVNR